MREWNNVACEEVREGESVGSPGVWWAPGVGREMKPPYRVWRRNFPEVIILLYTETEVPPKAPLQTRGADGGGYTILVYQ